jgi:hypothetical protein
MLPQLERLKKLVFEGGFDAESRHDILKLEEELQEIAAAEKLSLNPVIKKYIDHLDTEAKRSTYLLANDRTLTDLQRQTLFAKRDLCEHFSSLFTGQRKEVLEQEINDLLTTAQAQSNV